MIFDRARRSPASLFLFAGLALLPLGCGGGSGGGPGPAGAGQGLILQSFLQASLDNVAINQVLEFVFSEAVDPTSVGSGSIQVRAGPTFGLTAAGTFRTDGARVQFFPRLPGLCSYADAGLQPGTEYRVTLMGAPEEFALRNTKGQPLEKTLTLSFETLPDSDEGFLADQVPGAFPEVTSTTPANGASAVAVATGNEIVVRFDENVDPCTIKENNTVYLRAYEVGDKDVFLDAPSGRQSGFDPVADSRPSDPYSWGGNATPLSEARRVKCELALDQSLDATVLHVRPAVGKFPENCLLVLELRSMVEDLGGSPLAPYTLSFTTENVPEAEQSLAIEYDATTPIETGDTTADVNTARSPSRAQGWVSYGGDGDDGPPPVDIPSFPTLEPSDLSFVACEKRLNDGTKDAFDPDGDVTLYTGATRTDPACTNDSDGSTASVFEFSSFRIRTGVTVTIAGANPCIILVGGEVDIQTGATLRIRGSNAGNGVGTCQPGGSAGKGGPGGGAGATGGYQFQASSAYAEGGESGYGSQIPYKRPGQGGGQGGVAFLDPPWWGGSGVGGGGGGHTTPGTDGGAQKSDGSSTSWAATPLDGKGGGTYNDANVKLRTPLTGSGGGGGGANLGQVSTWQNTSCGGSTATGGGGGGGGGFLGITASGDIRIGGTIDARGGNGGNGGSSYYAGAAGGGGGSGGAVRLLTPGKLTLSGATITTAGGLGGTGTIGTYGTNGGTTGAPFYANAGGVGGIGRIVLEDGDSVIAGISTAILVPAEGDPGFYRGKLDPTRFTTGGTEAVATTEPIALGAILDPSAIRLAALEASDFVAGIPPGSDLGMGSTSMVVEMEGYLSTADDELDPASGTGYYVVGYFTHSGAADEPTWHADAAPPGFTPEAGVGIANLDGRAAFVQVRVWFYLVDTMKPNDPGPYIDLIRLRFTADN